MDLLKRRRMMWGQGGDPYAIIPLTFEISRGGNILWKAGSDDAAKTIEYSINDGAWTEILATTSGAAIPVTAGDVVRFRGTAFPGGGSNATACSFGVSGARFSALGNPSSLRYGERLTGKESIENNAFNRLFNECSGLVSAENLSLPATTLAIDCYAYLFYGCTSLAVAPKLPATNLMSGCYNSMFYNCSALENAPELPANVLAIGCYSFMFYNCTALKNAPELPATNLANSCYSNMFCNCQKLATEIILPAPILVRECYQRMLWNCKIIPGVKCYAETISASNALTTWLEYANPSGTFTKKAGVTWPSGVSGIPSGWTVVEV